ncbi:MAG: flavodoxin-dependent (E)-4-hydroxy-3-methylbut-2-enyl-diphosphate synthase [Clostridia bacterium]
MKKTVKIGNVNIGGCNKIAIQSMTNTKTKDVESTLNQIRELQAANCDIVRCAVFDKADAYAIKEIVLHSQLPIVADIHFDYNLAIASIENGAAKVRVNPGNLGVYERFDKVIDCAKLNGAAIRIGVNSGSINSDEMAKCNNKITAMLSSMKNYVIRAQERNFENLVLAGKLSDVKETVLLNRMIDNAFDYPIHIGVTEAGVQPIGMIKSAIGIGSLLLDGIGDTIRVSLTDSPVKEVYAAQAILQALGIEKNYVNVVSCPTCGRCQIDLIDIANAVNNHTLNIKKPLKIAVMGCAVNGPGEAKDADLGLAGGDNCAVFFKKGKIYKKVTENIIAEFLSEVDKILLEKQTIIK